MNIRKLNPLRLLDKRRMRGRSKKRNKVLSQVKLVAVTGSAGKTTTAHLLQHVLASSGKDVGLLCSSGIWHNDKAIEPDFVINLATEQEISSALIKLARGGAEVIIIEAPAASITKKHFFGMRFDAVILTNIGGGDFARDFASEEEYAQTMFSLLHQVEHEGLAVLNADDDSAAWIAATASTIQQDIYAVWSTRQDIEDLEITLTGSKFKFKGGFFETKTISRLYLENVLQAIHLASKYVGLDEVDNALNSYRGLKGREQMLKTQPFTVLVDYAYQPIVIEMLLSDIRQSIPSTSRVISILGAAGQRGDERKRVGIPAAKHSDVMFLTPQDPRGEDVVSINSQIAEYAEPYGGVLIERVSDLQEFENLSRQNLAEKIERVILNNDVPIVAFDSTSPVGRYNAIDYAAQIARPEDVIVLLGKGDDDLMDFGDVLYEWSDEKAVRDLLD